MKNDFSIPQLFLRLSLGIGFILPVMDRFGWLGPAGVHQVSWGNWSNFVDYTHSLMPFLSRPAAGLMGGIATAAEIVFGLLLITGYQTRLAAIGSFVLTLLFALSMAVFSGLKAPFNYSVFTDSAAGLLLSCIPVYKWSIDSYLYRTPIQK